MTRAELKVFADLDAARLCREALLPLRPTVGARFDDLLLVVSELVSNGVRHSKTRDIEVTVDTDTDTVRVEVGTDGPCFDPTYEADRGLGLVIVDRLSSAWGVDDSNGCVVWAELDIASVPSY